MKQSAPGNILIICEGCQGPLIISLLQESIIPITTSIMCVCCNHVHTELDALKNYAKQTRTYGLH